MWQVKAQNAESESYPTVSKEQFLAVLARMQDNANEEEPAYALKSAATFAVPPPPGLSLPPPIPTPPPMDDLACEMAVEKPAADDTDASKVEPLTIEPCKPPQQGYQVLLRDLSEMIAQEVTMRAILEQANLLEDVIRMDFRPGGKILMEFQTFASVPLCITHFHGRPWGKERVHQRIVRHGEASQRSQSDYGTAPGTWSGNEGFVMEHGRTRFRSKILDSAFGSGKRICAIIAPREDRCRARKGSFGRQHGGRARFGCRIGEFRLGE
jgi:hypothetical protein